MTLINDTKDTLEALTIELSPAANWSARIAEVPVENLAPGERTRARFAVTASEASEVDRNTRLGAFYAARVGEQEIRGSNCTWLRAASPVRARFQPLYDVAGYRDFAQETKTEWVIETLPARIPLHIGRPNIIDIEVTNASPETRRGTLRFEMPDGISVRDTIEFEAGPGRTITVPVELDVDEAILPAGRHSVKLPLHVTATAGSSVSRDTGDIYALPTLAAPMVAAPVIDGDLRDMESFPRAEISHEDQWWRRAPESDSDASAVFHVAYDKQNLYVGIRVRDDAVICNIAPDDIRAQLRSDAVGITVDPSGTSRDTSTVLQAAAFPCTTAGFGARGFRDADANQGLMEETAPGMEVASIRTEDGYTLEAKIPWAVMPHQPSPGDEIGLNVIIYDGDQQDARVGANISESGLGWAAFRWGGKQALPYLWPRVVLQL